MKKLLPYIMLLLLVFATSCSSDDNSKVEYTKISEDEKEALIGTWQLIRFEDFFEEVDLVEEHIDVYYQFKRDKTLDIKNESLNLIEYYPAYYFLTETKSLRYKFDNFRNFDNKNLVEEKVQLYNDVELSAFKFSIKVSENTMSFIDHEGDSMIGLMFVRVKNESNEI